MAGSIAGDEPHKTVGVIGLGIMGSAMAANLVQAGFAVFGTDTVAAKRAELENSGGRAVPDSGAVGRSCRYIVLSLPSEEALLRVGDELAASCVAGTIVIETSTIPLAVKSVVHARLAAAGITLLDCPVSGTGSQARKRDLVIFASGDRHAIEQAEPVMRGFARAVYNFGEFGNGMKVKAVANLLVGVHIVAAAEAVLLAVRSGLDPALTIQAVADGGGGSRMLQVRGPVMAERSWELANMKNSVWQKDLKLIADALASAGCAAPVFSATLPIYQEAMDSGHGEHDMAAVYEVLEHLSRKGRGSGSAT